MIWMTGDESRFVPDDREVVRDALDSDDSQWVAAELMSRMLSAIQLAIHERAESADPWQEMLEELGLFLKWVLDNALVSHGRQDFPFPGIGNHLVDEALRPRSNARATSQLKEIIRFTAIRLRKEALNHGARFTGPVCEEGEVVYARTEVGNIGALSACRSCEAAWYPGEALIPERSLNLTEVFQESPSPWDDLEIVPGADAGTA